MTKFAANQHLKTNGPKTADNTHTSRVETAPGRKLSTGTRRR